MERESFTAHSRRWAVIMGGAMFMIVAGLLYVAVVPEQGDHAPVPAYSKSAGAITPLAPSASDAGSMQLVVGGITHPFIPGDEIPVAGDVNARILVTSPAGGRHDRVIDIDLYQQTVTHPITDGTIRASARMIYMDHGVSRATAIPMGDGHYRLSLSLPMPGEWQADLDITAAGQEGTLQLLFDTFD